jgi:hypothetical protein
MNERTGCARTIRAQLGEVAEMTLRLRELSGPGRFLAALTASR